MAYSRLCSIPDCGKGSYRKKDFCQGHWRRIQRDGDPQVHIPLGQKPPKTPARDWLERHVSFCGDECLIWPFKKERFGYPQISVDGGTKSACRVMCRKAHGEPPTEEYQAAHSCGNGRGGCINPGHLRWATPVENHADRYIHGTADIGESSASAKLKEADVIQIRLTIGKTNVELASEFGVCPKTISSIRNRKTWTHIGPQI